MILLCRGLKKRHKDRKMSLVKEDAEEEVGLICKVNKPAPQAVRRPFPMQLHHYAQ